MSRSNLISLRWVGLTALLVSSLLLTTACGGGGGGSLVDPAIGTGEPPDVPVPMPPENPPPTPPPSGGDTGDDDDAGDGGDDGGDTVDDPPPAIAVPPAAEPLASWDGMQDVHAVAANTHTGQAWAINSRSGAVYLKDDLASAPAMVGVTIAGVRGLACTSPSGLLYATVDGGDAEPDHLYLIDRENFEATDLGAVGSHTALEGLAYLEQHGSFFSVDTVSDELVAIDPATAAPTVVGPLGGSFDAVSGLAADQATGRLWGTDVSQNVMVEIDAATGGATQVATMEQGELHGLAFLANAQMFYAADPAQAQLFVADPMGSRIRMDRILGLAYSTLEQTLYGSDVLNAMLVRIDPASGWKQYVGYTGVAQLESLAYDESRRSLFGVSTADGMLHAVNPLDGTAQIVGPVAGWSSVQSLACANGQLYGVDRATGDVLHVDPSTGLATLLGTVPHTGIQSLAHDPIVGQFHAYDDDMRMHLAIDPANMSAAQIAAPQTFAAIGGLAWDPANEKLWGSALSENALVAVWEAPAPDKMAYDEVHALALDVDDRLAGFDLGAEALLDIDRDTQTAVAVWDLPGVVLEAMTLDRIAGEIYAADAATQSLMVILPGARPQLVGTAGALGSAGIKALAHDPIMDVLYGVDLDGAGGATLVTIDQATGDVTAFGTTIGFDSIEALAYDPASQNLLGVDRLSRALVSIDTATGVGAQVAQLEEDLADVRGMTMLRAVGALLVVDATQDRVVRIDSVTGATLP